MEDINKGPGGPSEAEAKILPFPEIGTSVVQHFHDQLQACLYDDGSDAEDEKPLFVLGGLPCIYPKAVSIITAPVKSGKSSLCGLLMAAAVADETHVLDGEVQSIYGHIGVIYANTEMPLIDARRVLRRAMKTAFPGYHGEGWKDRGIYALNLTRKTIEERISLIADAIVRFRPRLVIIDGIADLCNTINSEQEAVRFMEELAAIAESSSCALIGVIHQNYNGTKTSGWLGTIVEKKATDLFSVKPNNDGLIVQYLRGRSVLSRNLFKFVKVPADDGSEYFAPASISESSDKNGTLKQLCSNAPLPCANSVLVRYWMNEKHCCKSTADKNIAQCVAVGLLTKSNDNGNSIYSIAE